MFARSEQSLRTAALTCRLQPILSRPSTHASSSPAAQLRSLRPSRPQASFLSSTPQLFTIASARHASTATKPAAVASSEAPETHHIDWNTFFKLRKTRRRLQLGSSIGTTAFGMLGGAQVLAMSDMDKIVSQVPLDPFITLGLITFSCGGLGWLMGPVVGTGIFNTLNRKAIPEMDIKEKEFYHRVKKFRVDPSASSMANPVPDYYGEKISSVSDYRQWLKDQRAFNKKRTTYIKM